MRALMKGKAAQFFQKKQKQVEDPEVIMNQIEAKVIAKYIGIDEQQINKYNGFFEQVAKIKLPKGFSRHPSSDKTKIFYVNEITGDEDTLHPSIDIIKMGFYKMLQDSNSVATFNTKSSKLLPFVQEKMIKQCIGLSSKRRDAQKANMQRDENGKIVMSKLARIKPDMKVLLSTRSYMLKALVEKIYTKKQIWGKGKKANVYAAILASEKGSGKANEQEDQQMQQTEQSLEQYEKIYTESKQFYDSKYGALRYIPEQLKATKSFYRSTPESVLRNLGILNIEKTRMELYWLARLMQCLPLPPGWSIRTGDSFDKFYYQPKKLLFDLHPSYIYVLEQMNSFKLAYQEMDIIHQNYYNNMKEMVFYDYFERQYNVDLYAYVEKMTEIPMTKKKAIKKSNQLGKNDWMALEGIKNSELDVKNAVIIQDILEYWSNLNCKQDNYIPAISPFGQVTWSSTINERTINFCPHAEILKITVEQKGLQMPRIQEKDLKQFNSLKQESLKRFQQLFYTNLPEQRQKFLQHYIRNDPKPLSQPFKLPVCYKELEFYQNIFITPFNLQSELNFESQSDVPLWLQKVHAKQNSDLYFSLINKNPQKFEEIKQQFTKYSMDMIKKHEPNRQQDIIRVLSEIRNNKELKKFILHINDIDGREQRKRLAAIGVVQQQQDSLGSSISQIQMEDKEEDQQSSEDELIDIEASKSDSEGKKQQSQESEEQNIVKVPTQESKRIQQVSQQQSEPEPEPQKYIGVSYEKQPILQKLSQQQLNQKIIALKKQKILKHKYSRSGIKDMVEKMSAQLLSEEFNSKQLNDRKKNALISRFQSQHGPYKVKPNLISHREPRISTALQNGKDKSQQFAPFKSQTSVLGNEQIDPQIRQQQQLIRKRNQQNLNDNKQHKNQDETKQTIQLQPIKRIKPDINDDTRLRHISQISELKQFSKIFNQSPSKLKNLKSQILRKTKKSIQQTTATTKFNPEKSISSIESIRNQNGSKNLVSKFESSKDKLDELQQQAVQMGNKRIFNNNSVSLQKSQSVLSFNNESLSPTKISSIYNRVCLGNTATNLLSTEPIIRRGQLIILEARKSLISKGRGIETMITKKY